jgi:predicted short-subunit dehydrogenase-like oxidoreductase (DUF2520 family)
VSAFAASTPGDRPPRLTVGVVGAGRVGAVLGAALHQAGHHVTAVAAVSEESRARAAELLPGVPVGDVPHVVTSVDLVLLAVPDDTLPSLVSGLAKVGAFRSGQVVVHTCGRFGVGVLEPAAFVGALPLALHPAMSFTGTAIDLDRLPGTVFGLTAEAEERPVVECLVADLGGTPMWVPEEMRTLYHAGLAHGANHLVTLVTEAMEILSAAGAADPAGTLRPLLTAALDNALEQGDAALTGPIVRGDLGTVRAHLEDITANAPQTLASYVALARATLDRAVTDGRVVPLRAARIRELLDAAAAGRPLRGVR